MRKLTLVCLALILVAGTAMASGVNRIQGYHVADSSYENNVLTSNGIASAKADTVYLLGGGNGTGEFQNDINPTLPDDEGWFGVDLTAKTLELWNISMFNSPTGTNAIWCGEVFASCGAGDPIEGYGNSYEEYLDWTGTVLDNGIATNVTVAFTANYDNEPGYDYLYLTHESAGGFTTVGTYNGSTKVAGVWTPVVANVVFTVAAADLVGPGANEVHLRFRATSDGGWSDSDCLWPTSGHSQIDDIAVSGTNGLPSTLDDFESGMITSNWQIAFPVAVGDFAKVWPQLQSIDPCTLNQTPQVAFVDDGVVVPCTGGTLGTSWTYGPGSYTHNLTGGCGGPTLHAQNEVWSPELDWSDELGNPLGGTHAGANFVFGVYPHLPIGNGMFYVWHVRSTSDGVTWSGWNDRNFVYYSNNGTYGRVTQGVNDLIENTPTKVQLALGIYELGWIWGLSGTDGTPAPYFDNIAFSIFQIDGPAITTRELEMAQDNFPDIGVIDYAVLANNSIRFDMANDILGDTYAAIQPGDSITYNVTAVRPGAVLNSRPELHWVMKANPLFGPAERTAVAANPVLGDTVFTTTGVVVPDRYGFDLPDAGFFFPGDVIHYYIKAQDNQLGNIGTTTLPGDLSGYGVYPGDPGYVNFDWPSSNIVHGLPTMFSAVPGDQPDMLFYNDFGGRGGENEWIRSLMELGFTEGQDFDTYYVNAPSSGVSNGLGSRATSIQIQYYDTMLYTFGNLSSYSLNQNDINSDKSDDLSMLDTWLPGKNLLATGDNIVFDLMTNQGTAGSNFVSTWLSVNYLQHNVSGLIGGQTAPVMVANGGHANYNTDMIAYGSCPALNTFDAVEAAGSAVRIAEWDAVGAYPTLAAGVQNFNAGSNVVYFPVDLMYWYTPQGFVPDTAAAITAARTDALAEILLDFGHLLGAPTAAQVPGVLTAKNFPNPFNPTTEIKFSVPRSGDVAITIYNVRGEKVRTLVNENYDAGSYSTTWNGTSDRGDAVASGVYFYEVRAGNSTVVNKMALVK